jgi:hypothetical protein
VQVGQRSPRAAAPCCGWVALRRAAAGPGRSRCAAGSSQRDPALDSSQRDPALDSSQRDPALDSFRSALRVQLCANLLLSLFTLKGLAT